MFLVGFSCYVIKCLYFIPNALLLGVHVTHWCLIFMTHTDVISTNHCTAQVFKSIAVWTEASWREWKLLRSVAVLSLQEFCCRTIASQTTIYGIEQLPLPTALKAHLKSYLLINKTHMRIHSFVHRDKHKKHRILKPSDTPTSCHRSCSIS